MTRGLKTIITFIIFINIIFFYGITVYKHSPVISSGNSLEAPSTEHILGTDNLGIDIFAQLSKGYFNSMIIGIVSAVISFGVGGFFGIMAGYVGRKIDMVISFLINIFLSVPQLPVMIVVGVFLGQSIWNVIFIISAFSWAPIAKVVREKTIDVSSRNYVRLAKSFGGNSLYIIRKHISREVLPILIINSIAVIGRAVIQESSLAFLGLSDPVSKSWGMMINKAINFKGIYFTPYWKWWLLSPVICLIVVTCVTRFLSKELEYIWGR